MKDQIKLPASVLRPRSNPQFRQYGPVPISTYGRGGKLFATVRWDDQCGNGHNTFSITGHVTVPNALNWAACGCLHEEISKGFPELAPLIKWHLTSSDGPMHYVANTVYLAGERDHHGLLKDERRQIRNGRTGLPCWILEASADLEKYVDALERPTAEATLRYVPLEEVGEGKARELNAARSAAVWPEATDAELSAPAEELTAKLLARLPALMEALKRDVEALGFVY